MEIRISHNFADVQRQLDRLQADVADKALRSALNKTAAQGKTQMVREIVGEFNLTATKVRQRLSVSKARFAAGRFGMYAEIYAEDKLGRERNSLNVINFGARSTPKGLTAKIKRNEGRKLISSVGFIGNKGRTAFKRIPGTTMSTRSRSRGKKHAEKIGGLLTIHVPQMFNTRRINAKVVAFIVRKFPELLERDIRYYTERFNARTS